MVLPLIGLVARGLIAGGEDAIVGGNLGVAGKISQAIGLGVNRSELGLAQRGGLAAVPTVTVTFDSSKALGFFQGVERQVRYATARTLNDTAFAIRAAEQVAIQRQLDRPTPFTVAGFQVEKSTTQNLRARLFIEAKRWAYLIYQVDGGVRLPKRRAVLIGETPRNQYGNIPGWQHKVEQLKRRYGRDLVSRKIGGVAGLWLFHRRGAKAGSERAARSVPNRKGGQWELLVIYKDSVSYRPRFFFYANAQPAVENMIKVWNEYMRQAIETATIK